MLFGGTGGGLYGRRGLHTGEDVVQTQLEGILGYGLGGLFLLNGGRCDGLGHGAVIRLRGGDFLDVGSVRNLLLQKPCAFLHGNRQTGIAHGAVGRG
jgi:hypothetical protein